MKTTVKKIVYMPIVLVGLALAGVYTDVPPAMARITSLNMAFE